MALEKIKFQTNIPVELALAFPDGKECESQFGGKQIMFTTVDERVFFVSPTVADKIRSLKPQRGERLDLTKKEVDYGNGRKGIEWEVLRVGNPPEPRPATLEVPRVVGAQTPTPANGQAANTQPHNSNGNGSVDPAFAAIPSAIEARSNGNGHMNGNGNGNGPKPAPAGLMTGQSQFILQQLIAAIEVCHAAENYSKAMGRPVAFTNEDIRAIAISCFIQQHKGAY